MHWPRRKGPTSSKCRAADDDIPDAGFEAVVEQEAMATMGERFPLEPLAVDATAGGHTSAGGEWV